MRAILENASEFLQLIAAQAFPEACPELSRSSKFFFFFFWRYLSSFALLEEANRPDEDTRTCRFLDSHHTDAEIEVSTALCSHVLGAVVVPSVSDYVHVYVYV